MKNERIAISILSTNATHTRNAAMLMFPLSSIISDARRKEVLRADNAIR